VDEPRLRCGVACEMTHRDCWYFLTVAACAAAVSCTDAAPRSKAAVAASDSQPRGSCDVVEARSVVEQFGQRLKRVSLLAPDSIVLGEIRQAYGSLVTPALLERWTATPNRAPGRKVSSPWPDRIEVRSIEAGAGGCHVRGDVIYVTSGAQPSGSIGARESVVLHVAPGTGGWRITDYSATSSYPAESTGASITDPADVIERYYAAINTGDFRRAYAQWENGGAASGKTLRDFAAGFSHTRQVQVESGTPSRVEPAAGSWYVEVPVIISAVTDSGTEQRFRGRYVLRRSVVDGAPVPDRQWRIYSADITRSR
jgi:hypothetical protein